MTKLEEYYFIKQGFKKQTKEDLQHMDLMNDKGIGYRTRNFQTYSQPPSPKNREELQAELQAEVVNTDAYQGRYANRALIAPYVPYWEKIRCINTQPFKCRTAEELREAHAETLANAIIDDGRLPIDKVELMNIEQLRMAAKELGL